MTRCDTMFWLQFVFVLSLQICFSESILDNQSTLVIDLGTSASVRPITDGDKVLKPGIEYLPLPHFGNLRPKQSIDLRDVSSRRNLELSQGILHQSDESVPGNYTSSHSGTDSESSHETHKITIPELFGTANNSNTSPILHSKENVSTSTLNVPSEGGVLQSQNTGLESSSLPFGSKMPAPGPLSKTLKEINAEGKTIHEDSQARLPAQESTSTRVTISLEQGYGKQEPANLSIDSSSSKPAFSLDSFKGANEGNQNSNVSLLKSSSEVPVIEHISKITPRKGAEPPKIFPRKGVPELITDSTSEEQDLHKVINDPQSSNILTSSTNMHISSNFKDISGTSQFNNSVLQNDSKTVSSVITKASSMSDSKADTSTTKIDERNGSSALSVTTSPNTTDPILLDKSGIIASYPPLKKRLKPQKTTDTNPIDNVHVSIEHTTSEHDYVIPIVVTILAVPMLIVLVLFLYKKGSECWERRHYRRMDFLIDGMYND